MHNPLMPKEPTNPDPAVRERYHQQLVELVRAANRDKIEIADWLAQGLAEVADELPEKAESLLARRVASWEAGLVRELINGTIGWPEDLDPALMPLRGRLL